MNSIRNNENMNAGLSLEFTTSLKPNNSTSRRAPLALISNKQGTTTVVSPKTKGIAQPIDASTVFQQVNTPPKTSIYLPSYKKIVMISPGVDQDRSNPQTASDFAKEIYIHAKHTELKYLPDPNYMENQSSITSNMRAIVVDWLVAVHRALRLVPGTLFLSVNIMDRFLTLKQVHKSKFQLIGLACLIIASKYEEVYSPEIEKFLAFAHLIQKVHVIQMESCILATVDFNLTVTTPFTFLTRYCKCGKVAADGQLLALFFSELALVDYDFLGFAPSVIACSSILLSNKFSGKQEAWDINLQYYSGFSDIELRPCTTRLLQLIKTQKSNNLTLKALRDKYLSPTRSKVANIALAKANLIQL